MPKYRKLSRVVYHHLFHIVWTPKYRFKVLRGDVKDFLEQILRQLCEWKRVEIEELNIQIDHIHIILNVPPKLSISDLIGVLKGKTAIKLFKTYPHFKKKLYWGNHFWSKGYFSSTIGLDEEMIKRYVKYQEKEERKIESEQMKFEL